MNESVICIDLISDESLDSDESKDGKAPADESRAASTNDSSGGNEKAVPTMIDLTWSDKEDDDDNRSMESYEPAAKQQRRHSDSAATRDELLLWTAARNRHEQEKSDEALARLLQAQEERGVVALHSDEESSANQRFQNHSDDSSLRELFPDPATTLSELRKSQNEYEIVTDVTKELDERFGHLLGSENEKRSLGWKMNKFLKRCSLVQPATEAELKQIVHWRNCLIHDTKVKRLSDLGIAKDTFIDAYSRILYSTLDLRPSSLMNIPRDRSRDARKRQRK